MKSRQKKYGKTFARTAVVTGLLSCSVLIASSASAASGSLNCGAQRTIYTTSQYSGGTSTHTHSLAGYGSFTFTSFGSIQVNWPAQGGSWFATPNGWRGCH